MSQEYLELVRAGAMLANCAFNLAQSDKLDERERRSLDESRKAWDAALPAYAATLRQAARVDEGMLRKAEGLRNALHAAECNLPEGWADAAAEWTRDAQELFDRLAALSAQPAEHSGDAAITEYYTDRNNSGQSPLAG